MFGRCSSGVPVAAAGRLIVVVAISFHCDTAFGPATVIVTGVSSSPPPQPRSAAAPMTAAQVKDIVLSCCMATAPRNVCRGNIPRLCVAGDSLRTVRGPRNSEPTNPLSTGLNPAEGR